jgi:type I restriction enzyme R subunit
VSSVVKGRIAQPCPFQIDDRTTDLPAAITGVLRYAFALRRLSSVLITKLQSVLTLSTISTACRFSAALETVLLRFSGIDRTDFSFAALAEAQQRIPAGDKREQFAREFMACEGLWELLWPNSVLDPHRADYRWLAHVYESVKPTGVSNALLWQRLGAKTLELVHGHITDVRVTATGLQEVIVDEATIEAIRQLTLIDQGTAASSLEPVTVEEALDTIEVRLRRRLAATHNHPVYVALSERLERLRTAQLHQASASVAFLRDLLELAQQIIAAEKADDAGTLDILPDPNVGALTQIFREYAPSDAPAVIESVVVDIDSVVKQVRFTGWNSTQAGDRVVRREVRSILKKYGLPTTGDLFDKAYAYIHENY